MDWQADAPCNGKTDLFFPDDEDPELDAKVQQAKSICEGCPFQKECLAQGMKEKFGVWGGKDPKERLQIKRATRKE